MDAESSFADACAQAASVLAGFGGYFIERISHDTAGCRIWPGCVSADQPTSMPWRQGCRSI